MKLELTEEEYKKRLWVLNAIANTFNTDVKIIAEYLKDKDISEEFIEERLEKFQKYGIIDYNQDEGNKGYYLTNP